MAAYYPGNIKNDFSTKTNNVTIVDASHPNTLQDEVVAIETIIGTNPHYATNVYTSSGYSTASTSSFSDLKSRLTNLEVGIVGDVHTQYVKVAGGSTIASATSTVKSLILKGASSQTANLQEWQNSSGTVLASVSAAGGLTDSVITPKLDNLYVVAYLFG